MAKLTGPLLSFGARGQIGKTLVASSWRGVKLARQYVVPANPQTQAQQNVRLTFAYLREMWKRAPSEIIDAWNAFALGRPFTGFNKFIGENVRVLNKQSDLNNMIFSPGNGGGLMQITESATAGSSSGEIDWSATAPSPPSDWTLVAAIAVAVPDADPTGVFLGGWQVERAVAPTLSGTLTGLGSAVDCQVGIYLEWTKPDGSTAYSPSQTVQATSGA